MFNVICYMTNGNLHSYNKCVSLIHSEGVISIKQEVYDGKCRTLTFNASEVLKIEVLEHD